MVMKGILEADTIKTEMLKLLEPLAVEYVAIVNRRFESIPEVAIGDTLILIAARVGTTRLIDNVWM